MLRNGYEIGNVDAVVIAQKPKLLGYIEDMRHQLSLSMHTTSERVNIKATTTEGLGFAGNGEGIAAQAIVNIVRSMNR